MAGVGLGLLWGAGLIWVGSTYVNLPIFTYNWTLALAFLFPGIVMALMVGRIAVRRFFDDDALEGAGFAPGSGAEIDARVLQNTFEQLVLALALWPVTGFILAANGPGVILCLGIGFALMRGLYWIGCHMSPLLRAFGFAATFYPTVMALIWAGLYWVLR
jgi:hypothetical protein